MAAKVTPEALEELRLAAEGARQLAQFCRHVEKVGRGAQTLLDLVDARRALDRDLEQVRQDKAALEEDLRGSRIARKQVEDARKRAEQVTADAERVAKEATERAYAAARHYADQVQTLTGEVDQLTERKRVIQGELLDLEARLEGLRAQEARLTAQVDELRTERATLAAAAVPQKEV